MSFGKGGEVVEQSEKNNNIISRNRQSGTEWQKTGQTNESAKVEICPRNRTMRRRKKDHIGRG